MPNKMPNKMRPVVFLAIKLSWVAGLGKSKLSYPGPKSRAIIELSSLPQF